MFSQAWPLSELTRQWTLLSGEPLLAEGKLSGDSPPQEINWNLKTINSHVEMRKWLGQASECKGQNSKVIFTFFQLFTVLAISTLQVKDPHVPPSAIQAVSRQWHPCLLVPPFHSQFHDGTCQGRTLPLSFQSCADTQPFQ